MVYVENQCVRRMDMNIIEGVLGVGIGTKEDVDFFVLGLFKFHEKPRHYDVSWFEGLREEWLENHIVSVHPLRQYLTLSTFIIIYKLNYVDSILTILQG